MTQPINTNPNELPMPQGFGPNAQPLPMPQGGDNPPPQPTPLQPWFHPLNTLNQAFQNAQWPVQSAQQVYQYGLNPYLHARNLIGQLIGANSGS